MRLAIERNVDGGRVLALKRGINNNDLRDPDLHRLEPEPLEGTRMDLFNSIIPNWWAENINGTTWTPGDAYLAEKIWVADRCIKLNAQQISTMPLQWHGSGEEPAWISNPDPHWYPNGICDAMHFLVEQIYGWGYSCQHVTDRYASGFPRTWTILDNRILEIKVRDGSRVYKYGKRSDGEDRFLDPAAIVQIDRNPGARVHGTPALRAYAQLVWGMLAAGNQAMTVTQGGIPQSVLKSQRKLTSEQAQQIQTQWMDATSRRNGAPPVLPPELDFTTLSFNPSDMALLDTQEFDAKAIMTAFGVPSVLLNMALQGGLTYQNPAALGEMWWRFELRQLATRIAQAFSAQMLPRGQAITVDAADTFAAIDEEDDPQASLASVKATPAQQNGAAPTIPRMEPEPPTVTFAEGAIQTAAPSVIVRPPQVHVEVHPGSTRKTVTFSDGRKATIDEHETAEATT